MQYTAHSSVGIGSGFVFAAFINLEIEYTAIVVGASAIGSLFPDIDHRGSWVSKRLKISSFIFSGLFQHRGFTHTPLFVFLSWFVLSLFNFFILNDSYLIDLFIYGFSIGMLSHIFLDWFTPSGVPLIFPLSKEKQSLNLFKTGGVGEVLFQALGVFMTILSFVYLIKF